MGMFDYIECRIPLPEPTPPEGIEWQTKDTPDQYLTRYVISEDGRLIELGYRVEDRSDPNATGLMRLRGAATRIYDVALDKVIDYHGDIEFYGCNDATKEWWTYVARFTDGRCVRIWLEEYTAPENTP